MKGFQGLDICTIYDFETLSQNPVDGVVISFAMLNYDPMRFAKDPYTYQELLDKCHYIKFDVADQVKSYNRKIEKDTVEWWSRQNKEAQKKIAPRPDDKSIAELYNFFVVNRCTNLKKVYTRRNTFDPVFMTSLMKATGNPEPYDWWSVRDTISYIEGLSHGIDIDTGFIPEGLAEHFVKHDPCHDIAMDVMRMQVIVQAIILGDVHA
jgi:hypothetical protein